MNLFSIYDMNSMQNAISTLEIFERNTGLKLNYDKTNVYRIGSLRDTNSKIYTTKTPNWTNETINALGVAINHSDKIMLAQNYDGIVKKIRNILGFCYA